MGVASRPGGEPPPSAVPRWLLLLHQLPPKPEALRVKTWRRLQRMGAVAVKNAAYVLPNTPRAREDMEWLLREIVDAGGDAVLCETRLVQGLADAEVEASFREARRSDYADLAVEAKELPSGIPDPATGRPPRRAQVGRLRRRLEEIRAIDYFDAPGREQAERAIDELEATSLGRHLAADWAPTGASALKGRVWVTRAGVHVDRIASAWLIRRFVDPEARFKFVPDRGYERTADELRFDMFEGEFTHEGEECTFEVLLRSLGLDDPALDQIAAIVHDIDLKDEKFGRPERAGVERLMEAIRDAPLDDDARLERGGAVLDLLYDSFRGDRGAAPTIAEEHVESLEQRGDT